MQALRQADLESRRHRTAMQAPWQESASVPSYFSDVGRIFDFPATWRKSQGNDCRFYLIVATRDNLIDDEGGKPSRVAMS